MYVLVYACTTNEVLLFEYVALFELKVCVCVCVSGRVNCTLPCAYVGTSLSCVSKCVLSPGAVSSCVKGRLVFLPHFSSLFACEKS